MLYDENNNYYDFIFKEKNEIYNFDEINIENKQKNFTNNMSFDIGSINVNNFRHNDKTTSPIEGLNKGNLFPDSYIPYKKYVYTIKVNGKREEMLLKIQALTFAIIDLELYLDLHPTETSKLELIRKYQKELNELKDIYSKEYNPLNLCDMNNKEKFTWINNPWPWDRGGN